MEASCSFGAGPSQTTFERPRSSLPVTTRRIGLRLDAIERLLREIFQLVYQAVECTAEATAPFPSIMSALRTTRPRTAPAVRNLRSSVVAVSQVFFLIPPPSSLIPQVAIALVLFLSA